MPDPRRELGQIGPHGDPNGDAAWLAGQAGKDANIGTVSGSSYDDLTHSPPGDHTMNSYEEVKHSGVAC